QHQRDESHLVSSNGEGTVPANKAWSTSPGDREARVAWYLRDRSKPLLDELGGAQQRARLRLGLAPLELGDRVGDDPGRRLHVQLAVLDDSGADGDGDVHVAGIAQVAAGAA